MSDVSLLDSFGYSSANLSKTAIRLVFLDAIRTLQKVRVSVPDKIS